MVTYVLMRCLATDITVRLYVHATDYGWLKTVWISDDHPKGPPLNTHKLLLSGSQHYPQSGSKGLDNKVLVKYIYSRLVYKLILRSCVSRPDCYALAHD